MGQREQNAGLEPASSVDEAEAALQAAAPANQMKPGTIVEGSPLTVVKEDAAPTSPVEMARIVSVKVRDAMYPLVYPVEFNGVTYSEVRMKRCSGKDVADYMSAMESTDNPASLMPPFLDFPRAVYDQMDDDDRLGLEVAVVPFIPQRLSAALDLFQPNIADTLASSPASSAQASPKSTPENG